MKSFKEHAKEIREAGKSEPSPEAVARTKRGFLIAGIIIIVITVILWIAVSC